jgi:methylated-DNA-[protein]-cysteine S-methyltransferase
LAPFISAAGHARQNKTEKMLYYAVFNTALGWAGLLGSKAGLRGVSLPLPTEQAAVMALGSEAEHAVMSTDFFADLIKRFQDYFSGKSSSFPDRLDHKGFTPFQCKVWEAARFIPYAETRSYGWIALQIKNPGAARAVGQALGRNPFPVIVPCHRVLAYDGSLGGFTGGLELKKRLLALEKVAV